MRKLKSGKPKNQLVGESTASTGVFWKRRPSELKGYQRALYFNDSDGNYVRIDYNIKSQKVRLFYEAADEGGVSYASTVEKGSVTSERNLTSGRTTSLTKKFSALAPLIATLPNKEVLRILGKNYGLDEYTKELREKLKRQKLESTRRRYFGNEASEREPFLGDFDAGKGIQFLDFVDIVIGSGVAFLIFWFFFNYQYLGGFLAFFGIGIGLFDIFRREREPLFLKILLFLVTGLSFFIYGYYIN